MSAVVVGGAGGIGFAVAKRLVGRGMRVGIWDLKPQPYIDSLVKTLGENSVIGISCDITKIDEVESAFQRTTKSIGPITILVNSAGIVTHASFLDIPPERWRREIETNLIGAANTIRVVLPGMLEAGGGIVVNICSIFSTRSSPMRSAYVASKWGLLGLTKALSDEYKHRRIRFVAVSPGPVLTDMTKDLVSEKPPAGWMTPDDIADVVEFVISDKGSNIVGGEIQVYGWAEPPVQPPE